MAVTWKINGTAIGAMGIERAMLRYVNQQADSFTFENPSVEFDTNAAYTTSPTVTISGGGGTGATATAAIAAGVVSGLTLTAAGTGFTSAPAVTLEGGGSFGATATATLTPTTVASATLTAAGSGFTSAPTVSVSGGGGSGAAFTAVLATRAVASLAVTAGGTGYTSAPTVVFTGGGGTGATATAVLSGGSVVSLSLTGAGSGYTSAPTIALTGGGGTGATASAALTATSVASAALSDAGSGFITAPAVTVSGGGGTGAAITAVLTPTSVLAVNVSNGGSGYTSPPTIAITGGGGSGATAVALLSAGSVASIAVTAGGSGYTGAVQVTISGGGGSGATAYCNLTGSGVGKCFPGTTAMYGWVGTPTVSFVVGSGGGSGAAATAVVDGIVASVSLMNFGSGYTSRPTVTLSGGGGSGAEVIAEIASGQVVKLSLIRHGTGYTSAPTLTISGGGGSGATGAANYDTAIVDITITAAGSGYERPPSLRFTYGARVETGYTTLVATSLASIVVTAGGSGYTTAPTVSFNAYTYGTAWLYGVIVAGALDDLLLRDIDPSGYLVYLGGANYATAPAITISGGSGSGATATASVSGGAITGFTITAAGSGYTNPSALVTAAAAPAGGSGATATASLGVTVASIAITAAGTGYTSAPTVSLSGGGGTGATATAVLTPTTLASLTVSAGGTGYVSAPTIAIALGVGVGATLATATAALTGTTLASLAVTAGGTGYTSAPTVGFTGGGGTGATATAAIDTQVASITLTAAGSGYTSAPTISFTGGGGSGAAADATLTTAALASLTLDTAGSGYTSAPVLTISGGGGTGATAVAVLTPTTVAGLVLTNNGGVLLPDTAIVLTRAEAGAEVTWFQGAIRSTPRSRSARDNRIAYVAQGPWQWLERLPYLQLFQQAETPTDPLSALVPYYRGRVILGQNEAGTRVTLGEFLNLVLDYAIAAKPGVMQRADFRTMLTGTVPWDEVTDLSCAEVISRALQLLPDAVCAWDYTVSPPRLDIARRSAMEVLALPVQPAGTSDSAAYVPFESIDLRERPDLKKAAVYLCYLATNRANDTQWETATVDAYPVDAVPNHPDTLVRTIQLAGSVATSTSLEQRIDVDPLESYLDYTTAAWLTSGTQFDSLKTWWLNHAKELDSAKIVVKGFIACARTGDTIGTSGQLNNELVAGAITDWMESNMDIRSEDQQVTAYIAFEEANPNDATKKARHIKKFVATVRATNASTRTYSFTSGAESTEAETVPTGLAQMIHEAISVTQHDGSLAIVESEPTRYALVGRTINLTGSLSAWEEMAAVVQSAQIDLDRGETRLVVGPPKQLGPDDLIELYRVNRTRQPVLGYNTRATGLTGSVGGNQGLGRHHRGGSRATGTAQAPARYTSAVTVAGTVPTAAEISAAVLAAYSGTNIPVEGDVVSLTISGTVKFQAIVTLTAIAADGWRRVAFTFASVSYYAWVSQVGLL